MNRRVEIGGVRIRLLPQPGFDLENFVVSDNPVFGAEPVLRAQEVTASLRISSLLRGHLEVSRLSLTEPSLNLTRNSEGRWNIEDLLERTAHSSIAPTSKARSEPRPGFPYIEADRGRVNFKFESEKKPFALTDATYSLWQDSENTWGMRLRARPVRTDLNITDMGEFRASGTWQRAGSLHETPLQFSMSWDGTQLGQLTKLISGQDKGWRGTVRLAAELSGTPASLAIRSDGSIGDFRKYDVTDRRPLEFQTHCDAHYSTNDRTVNKILCLAPFGDGAVAVRGEVANLAGPRSYDLNLAADGIPVATLVDFIGQIEKGVPADLSTRGALAADFNVRSSGTGDFEMTGGGQATNLVLQSASEKSALNLGAVTFALVTGESRTAQKGKRTRRGDTVLAKEPSEPRLTFGPLPVRLGRPSPATVRAWVTYSGYNVSLEGEADLQRLLPALRTVGAVAMRPSVDGWTKVALEVGGAWEGSLSPKMTGTAQLHTVQVDVRGLNGPLEINSASLRLSPDEVKVGDVAASVGGTRVTGSLLIPRVCNAADTCPTTFDLHADEIAIANLNALLNPNPSKRPWYRFVSGSSDGGPMFLATMQAKGKLSTGRLVIGNLIATRVAVDVELSKGQLHLNAMTGDVLGGKHNGEWRADFGVKPPAYSGTGTLEGVALGQVAAAMHDSWVSGTASGKYGFKMTGYSTAELLNSAMGALNFNMRDGIFPHVLLASSPLRVRRFSGALVVEDGDLILQNGTLDAQNGTFVVTGKTALGRKLDLKLAQDHSSGYAITGTLADPQVAAARHPQTEAVLKP